MLCLRIPFCLLLLFIIAGNSSIAQPKKHSTNSLKKKLTQTRNPHDQADLLNQLARDFREHGEKDSSLVYAEKAKKLSERRHYEKGMTDAYLNLGTTYREMNRFPQASKYLKLLLEICGKTNNRQGAGDAYDNFGHLYLAQGDSVKALKNHLHSLKIRKQIGDDYGIGNSNDNIAHIYASRNDYVNSIRYFEAALKVFEKIGDESRIALGAANVANQYYYIGNYHTALKNLYRAQRYYKRTKSLEGEIWICNLIGNIYSDAGNYDEALKIYGRALEIAKQTGEWWSEVDVYTLLGRTYMMMESYPKAAAYFQKARKISMKNNEPMRVMIAVYFIGDNYRTQKMNDEALNWFLDAFKMASEQNNRQWQGSISERIGRIYYDKKNYLEAKKWLMNSLEIHREFFIMRDLAQNYQVLSETNSALGNYKEAFENHKEYLKYSKLLQKNDASKLVLKYEFNKKESASRAEQGKKDALALRELKSKNMQRNMAIAGLLLMMLLLGSLLYVFRLRSKKLQVEKLNVQLKDREMKAVKETEQFKSRFLTNISHEFRTPLTLINGHLELLKQIDDGKNLTRYLEMENNGKRLLQLINQLLDLSKMESGQYQLRFSSGNVLNEVQAHVQTFHSYADQLGVTLTMEIAGSQFTRDPFVYSSEALSAILANLLSNALKFTPSGGSVHMQVQVNDEALILTVSDTGSGIPEQQLDNVFERFYQVDDGGERFHSGSGIGLALVKELVILHGGEISVKNAPTGGCIFTVSLANRKESREETEAATEFKTYLPEQIDSEGSIPESAVLNEELPLILVVEDQEQLRKFICECLGESYRYIEAPDGFRGLELANESLPDLIISDVMMPGMNGIEFCSQVKNNELTSHIPVVLLTAKAEQSDKETGLETGADDYLVKPFSISELKLRVRNMLRLRQLIRDKLAENPVSAADELSGLTERDREFLRKLSTITTENISNTQFGVNPLAESVHLSSSQLTRKLKALTGNTPADFIRNIRLQKALEGLQSGMSIADVAWEVGFEDPSYFAKVFKKRFGVPPSETDKLKP